MPDPSHAPTTRWEIEADDRASGAEQLRDHAGDRAWLEASHDVFVARLHRRSDDYDATNDLRLVSAALRELPRPRPVVSTWS